MAPGARLWVIEQVLPPEDDPDPSERAGLTLMDLNMLVLFGGGKQRTGEEYRRLLGSAGFDEVAVVPAEGTPWSVVERSEEHTSELQSRQYLVCRLLLEKKKPTHPNLHVDKRQTL